MNKNAFLEGYVRKTAEEDEGMSSTTKGMLLGASVPAALELSRHGMSPGWGALKGMLKAPGGVKLLAFLGLTGAGAYTGGKLAGIDDEQRARNSRKSSLSTRAKNMNPFA